MSVEITSPDKLLFPDDGITKADLASYYERVAEWMLPHAAAPREHAALPRWDRWQGLLPQGHARPLPRLDQARGGSEVRRHDHPPLRSRTRTRSSTWWGRTRSRHTSGSRARTGSRSRTGSCSTSTRRRTASSATCAAPPGHGRAAARARPRAFRPGHGLEGHPRLVAAPQSEPTTRTSESSRRAARVLAERHPEQLTTEFRKNKREGRILVDVARNTYAQTVVPPYAVRPRPGAPVAVPIEWDELSDSKLRSDRWTLKTVLRRLAAKGDPWAEMQSYARGTSRARKRSTPCCSEPPARARTRRSPPRGSSAPGSRPRDHLTGHGQHAHPRRPPA